jgi:hypothetical protein
MYVGVSENFKVRVISSVEQVTCVKSGAAVLCCILLVTAIFFMSACAVANRAAKR